MLLLFIIIGTEFEAAIVVHAHTQDIHTKVAPSCISLLEVYNTMPSLDVVVDNGEKLGLFVVVTAVPAIYTEPYLTKRSMFLIFFSRPCIY